MSHEGEEDLLEYSDNEQEIQIDASKAAEAGETGAATLQLKVIIITTLQLATRKVPMLVSIPPVSKISC